MDEGQTMNTPGSGRGTRPDGGKPARTADELRTSESWFRSLLETTSDWLWEIDTKGVFCYASPKVKDLLGYEPDEVIGRRPLDLMPPDEAGRMAGTLHEHALNRRPFLRMEHWNQHKTGQLVLIETSGVPLFDEEGVWCGFRGINRDVTDRRKTEQALIESEKKFRTIFESANDSIFLIKDDKFVDCNSMTLQMFQCTREQIIGQSPYRFFPVVQPDGRDSKDMALEKIKAVLSGWPQRFEWRHLHYDRTTFDAEVSLGCLDLKGELFIQAVVRDVTERKLAEDELARYRDHLEGLVEQRTAELKLINERLKLEIEERTRTEKALRKSEEKYRAIFEGSPEGIYQVSPGGRFLSTNPALAGMLGYGSPQELMGAVTDLGRQLYVDPEIRDKALKFLTESGVYEGLEAQCLRKDGSAVWVLLNAHLVYDENGDILYHEGTCRDITERKRMEQELKFKNILLSVQQEVSIDGVLVVGEDGTILSFNSRFVQMFGIPGEVMDTRSDEQALNAALDKISEPDQFLRKVNHLYEHKQERSSDEVALRDGRTFDRYSSPMIGPDGHYYGRVWYFRDITRRKEAEEALRKSEAKYRSLLESILDGVYAIDCHGRFTFVNDVIAERSNLPREWFIGKHFTEVIKPQYRTKAQESFDAHMRGEEIPPYEVLLEYGRSAGGELWTEVNTSVLYENGGAVGVIGISRDISDRKRAEQALRHSENRYRTLLESIQDGVWIVGKDRRFTFVNDVIAKRSGYPPEWFYGRTHSDLVKPEVREAVQARIEACFRGEKVPPYEVSYLNASRSEVWVESHISPLYEGEEIAALMGVNRDITDRKHLEEELRRHRDHLGQLVVERTAALSESEKRYRGLVDNALVGVYQSTLEGEILYHNDCFIRMVGFETLDQIKASGSPLRYRNRADRELLLRALEESGGVTKYETEFLTRDGEILNVLVSASLTGNVISGMVLDITDRKKAEEALRTSEQNLRLVFNSTADGIAIHDVRGNILEVNDKLLDMYDVSREKALGLSIINDYSATDQPLDQLPKVWESVIEGIDHLFEWKNRRPDGSTLDVEVFNTKIHIGGRDLILAMIRDITERKRTEELLQESERNYRDLVDNALVGVYKTRMNGEVLYVNPTLLRMAGFKSIEEMGSVASLYANPGDRRTLIGFLKEVGAVRNREVGLLSGQGKIISVLLSATLEGDVISGMVIDITDRKKAETELEEKSIRLQDTNTALKVLLDQREEDKREMEGRFRANLKSLVVPYIESLLNSPLTPRQKSMVESMEANIHIILSPLMKNSHDYYAQFTPTEVVVADLIKEGKSTKEIAMRLSVTESAVNLHRLNIRNKLGLKNVKRNLRSYLLSFSS